VKSAAASLGIDHLDAVGRHGDVVDDRRRPLPAPGPVHGETGHGLAETMPPSEEESTFEARFDQIRMQPNGWQPHAV